VEIFLYIVFAYLLGAVPFAYIITKIVRGVDIRTVGSGNAGATNVFRAAGKTAGIITFLLDVLKGFVAVYFAKFINVSPVFIMAVAACVILGHTYTVFLKFKGGKGVATGCGAFFALMPVPVLISLAVFAAVFVSSGYVALGSIVAALCLPVVAYLFSYPLWLVIFAAVLAAFIIIKHKPNIKRLLNGTENKFNVKGNKK
jgi:glycerol-3-phosphate acyltransferase PlsY